MTRRPAVSFAAGPVALLRGAASTLAGHRPHAAGHSINVTVAAITRSQLERV